MHTRKCTLCDAIVRIFESTQERETLSICTSSSASRGRSSCTRAFLCVSERGCIVGRGKLCKNASIYIYMSLMYAHVFACVCSMSLMRVFQLTLHLDITSHSVFESMLNTSICMYEAILCVVGCIPRCTRQISIAQSLTLLFGAFSFISGTCLLPIRAPTLRICNRFILNVCACMSMMHFVHFVSSVPPDKSPS